MVKHPSNFFRRMSSEVPPNPLFDAEFYTSSYPEVDKNRAYVHYCDIGVAKGYNPNKWFDTSWYLTVYPDVANKGENPLEHYWKFGTAEGRDPSLRFSTLMYLAVYPDVALDRWNPLHHFMVHGKRDGRHPIPVSILPPSKYNKRITSLDDRDPETNSNICRLLSHTGDWVDQFWVWMYFRRIAMGDETPSSEVSDSSPGADHVASPSELAQPNDFRPSHLAITLVQAGLKLYLLKASTRHQFDEEKLVGHVDEEIESSSFWKEKESEAIRSGLEADSANVKIGHEISTRLWRELYFVANNLGVSHQSIYITENRMFSCELLSKLEAVLPLHPMNRPLFFYILHDDLLTFVQKCQVIEGRWGALRVQGGALILSGRPNSVDTGPKIRTRRRVIV